MTADIWIHDGPLHEIPEIMHLCVRKIATIVVAGDNIMKLIQIIVEHSHS
ncbi:MAG: hypothetical protein WB588_01205 [Dehalococcoidia bacterium]